MGFEGGMPRFFTLKLRPQIQARSDLEDIAQTGFSQFPRAAEGYHLLVRVEVVQDELARHWLSEGLLQSHGRVYAPCFPLMLQKA